MKTVIDHYIADALDDCFNSEHEAELMDPDREGDAYAASRDVDEDASTQLTRDVAFRRRSFGMDDDGSVREGNGAVQVGVDGIRVELVQGLDVVAFKEVCAEAIASTTGADPATIKWQEMLQGGLQTALETQVVVFRVDGVSRACTHQLVRTRKASFHQQSQRATWYGDQPETRIADSVWDNSRARSAALRAMYWAHEAYRVAVEEDISYQDARLNLGEGTTNRIICEYPLRTFIDTYAYRGCSMFQWEHVYVMRKMRQLLVNRHPFLETHIKISCEKTHGALDGDDTTIEDDPPGRWSHACTYQGHERVEEQCDFPWARENNRTFQPLNEKIEQK